MIETCNIQVGNVHYNRPSYRIVEIRGDNAWVTYGNRVCNGIVGGVRIALCISILYCKLIGSCLEVPCICHISYLYDRNIKIRLNIQLIAVQVTLIIYRVTQNGTGSKGIRKIIYVKVSTGI